MTAELVATLFVGAPTDLGFDPTSKFLLVSSHAGRGVFDLLSKERVARDLNADYSFVSKERGAILGIGPLDGIWIEASGMFTFDGIRSPRRGHVIRYSAGVPHKIIVDDVVVATDDGELRALDLSPDGRWLALAYSDGIDLYELTF